MSDKEKVIDMELKPFEPICEAITDKLKTMTVGSEEATVNDVMTIAKALGYVVDVKKDIVEMCYKKTLIKAMEENEGDYGKTWDENGVKYYTAPKYRMTPEMYKDDTPEHYRDMDKKDRRVMYYTETNMNRMNDGMDEMNKMNNMDHMQHDAKMGKSGMSRKRYMESKEMHSDDKKLNQTNVEMLAADTVTDLREVWQIMSPEEKTIMKAKLNAFINTI